jgi:hypothetical protein
LAALTGDSLWVMMICADVIGFGSSGLDISVLVSVSSGSVRGSTLVTGAKDELMNHD